MPIEEDGAKTNAAIVKPLMFAWLEYEDSRDAVVFCHTMTSRLGAINLFSLLPPDPTDPMKRIDNNKPALDIRFQLPKPRPKYPQRSIIGFPETEIQYFLDYWIGNPGIENGKMVTNNTPNQADILVISGHGGGGTIYGTGSPSGKRSHYELARRIARIASLSNQMGRSGRLKYLIIPACTALHKSLYERWLPLFKMQKPLYGVLGYQGVYKGDDIGAQVMDAFTIAMKNNLKTPIHEAWASANNKHGQPWACFINEGAEGVSYLDLANGQANNIMVKNTGSAKYYDSNYPKGRFLSSDQYLLQYLDSTGKIINADNRSDNAFVSGDKGIIRIDCNGSPNFKRGNKIHLFIYLFQYVHGGINLNALFEFDSSLLNINPNTKKPIIQLLKNANPNTPTEYANYNGILIIVPDDTNRIDLSFRIKPNLDSSFQRIGPDDSKGRRTYGVFPLGMFPPNTAPKAGPPPNYPLAHGPYVSVT